MGLARLERILRCALAALLLLGTAARAESFIDVSALSVERSDEGVLLSANLRFDLPVVVDDALAKGIPMFFVADAFLMRDRWYWYDKQVASATRHMRLSYQPLTRRWRLVVSAAPVGTAGLALGQIFDSREEALAAVQRISHWKIADLQELDPEARYSVDFRFRLDVSQLPRPFQIGTVGHGDWSINAARNVRLAPEPAR
ncbi:DUF4390 domain-containing protein [Ramlibacter aquaticus]|uniref:DUF4390 domain-containing protein n=2 Tax=Comamonadaceae TaxID=80864 RepID=A0ABR9SIF0_9BURK|nr:DUF4390 domain-containing protein [Ramlibacter aquaticus]